jgi:ABC-type Na+ efflux pump permease subunit
VIQRYLEEMDGRSEDLAETFLETRSAGSKPEAANPVTQIIGPLMAGMMVFYSFYTGVATAESILREEEERTLPRLFTTPTSQTTILSGKFLAVLTTVLIQIIVLILFGHFAFGIQWGNGGSLAWIIAGTVLFYFRPVRELVSEKHQTRRRCVWRF